MGFVVVKFVAAFFLLTTTLHAADNQLITFLNDSYRRIEQGPLRGNNREYLLSVFSQEKKSAEALLADSSPQARQELQNRTRWFQVLEKSHNIAIQQYESVKHSLAEYRDYDAEKTPEEMRIVDRAMHDVLLARFLRLLQSKITPEERYPPLSLPTSTTSVSIVRDALMAIRSEMAGESFFARQKGRAVKIAKRMGRLFRWPWGKQKIASEIRLREQRPSKQDYEWERIVTYPITEPQVEAPKAVPVVVDKRMESQVEQPLPSQRISREQKSELRKEVKPFVEKKRLSDEEMRRQKMRARKPGERPEKRVREKRPEQRERALDDRVARKAPPVRYKRRPTPALRSSRRQEAMADKQAQDEREEEEKPEEEAEDEVRVDDEKEKDRERRKEKEKRKKKKKKRKEKERKRRAAEKKRQELNSPKAEAVSAQKEARRISQKACIRAKTCANEANFVAELTSGLSNLNYMNLELFKLVAI